MTKKIENFIDNVIEEKKEQFKTMMGNCLLYTSPSPRD